MKVLLKTYWYIHAFARKRGGVVFLGVLVGVIVFTSMLAVFPSIPRPKKTIYVGRVGSYALSTLPKDIQLKISRGLTAIGNRQVVIPDLAERWSVEADGRTYRFILKRNIYWQDGKLFTPSDIEFAFSDIQVSRTPNEIVLTLKDPFAPFPAVMSQPLFRTVRSRVFLVIPVQRIIGLGDYSIRRITTKDNRITELVLDGKQETYIYRFYQNEQRAITAFKSGEVDRLEELSSVSEMAEWKNVEIKPVLRQDRYLGLFFETTSPLFEKEIRQALNYAIPKPQGQEHAKSPVSPDSWAYNGAVRSYDYDIEKSVELLLRNLPRVPLAIELTTSALFQRDAERIKEQWERLGHLAEERCRATQKEKSVCPNLAIAVQLKVTDFPDPQNFQVILAGQQIPSDPDQYALFHSTQRSNIMRYKNPRVDKLLEDARKEVDPDERQLLYHDFQQAVVDDSPIIFLKFLTEYDAQRK